MTKRKKKRMTSKQKIQIKKTYLLFPALSEQKNLFDSKICHLLESLDS